MPELPDVEGWKRYFNRFARDRRICAVAAPTGRQLKNTSGAGLGSTITRARFCRADRHGKWLLAPTTAGATVIFHFGMTGSLTWSHEPDGPHDHDRIVFDLEGGRLTYRSQRMLGGVWLARDDGQIADVVGDLGPDAAAVGRDELHDLLDGRRGTIKSALMDQRLLAGVGNELSDEILWRARVHPNEPVEELDLREIDDLHAALDEIVREASKHGRIPDDDGWLESVRGADDPTCPRCGADIERIDAAGRTAYVCTREQQPA